MKARLAILLAMAAVVWFAANRHELRSIERDMAQRSGLTLTLRAANPFSLKHLTLSMERKPYDVPGEREMKSIMDRVPSYCGSFDIAANDTILIRVDMDRFRGDGTPDDFVLRMIESAGLREKNGSYSEHCFAAYELFEEIMRNWGD